MSRGGFVFVWAENIKWGAKPGATILIKNKIILKSAEKHRRISKIKTSFTKVRYLQQLAFLDILIM